MIFITILSTFIFLLINSLEGTKKVKNKNNPHYKSLLVKRNSVLINITDGFLVILAVVLITATLPGFLGDISILIRSNDVIMIFFLLLTTRSLLGYLVLRYYERSMRGIEKS
ncbi:hypothetical protein AALA58_01640 [Lactococcus ileimucosae]